MQISINIERITMEITKNCLSRSFLHVILALNFKTLLLRERKIPLTVLLFNVFLSRIERATIFPSAKVTHFDSVRYIRKGQKNFPRTVRDDRTTSHWQIHKGIE